MIYKKTLLQKYGYNTISYQSLMDWLETFQVDGIEWYISYIKVGRWSYIVVGDPICSDNNIMKLVHSFRTTVLAKRWRILFLSLSEKRREYFEIMWFWVLEIGKEALFDISNFTLEWKEKRDVRNLIRRAKKEGAVIRHITNLSNDDRQKIEELNSDWLTTRKTKWFSFLLKLSPFENLEDKILFVVEQEEKIVWYLSAVPIYGRNGFYFEDIIRSNNSPLGTNQLLVISAVEYLKEQGYDVASLGTSPLWNIDKKNSVKHKKTHAILKLIYKRVHGFYNFKWLYHFKKSLCPSIWEAKYIAFYPPKLRPKVFLAIAKAYNPRGITGIVLSRIIKIVFHKK